MSSRHITRRLLAAAALLAAAQVQATTASASLSNVQLRVIDLDPLDGMTANVTVSAGGSFMGSYVALGGTFSDGAYVFASDGASLGPRSWGSGTNATTGEITAGTLLGGPGPAASAWATASGVGNRSALDAGSTTYQFTLSRRPNALLVLSASAPTVEATADAGESASAAVNLHLTNANQSSQSFSSAYRSVDADGNASQGAASELQASFANLSLVSQSGSFDFGVHVLAVGAVASAVPEPGGAGLAAVGLSALAVLARRRPR